MLPFEARRIAKPHPDEVKKFMHQDAAVFAGIAKEFAIEYDEAAAQPGGGVGGISRGVPQRVGIAHFNWFAFEHGFPLV